MRILKVMGILSEESRARSLLPPYRRIQTNGARIVDEWLPALDWSKDAVWEWSADHPVARHWTYDSVPDRRGTSRCSCSLCSFASLRDLLIAIGRRPLLAALYEEVERVRGDSLRSDWRIHELIHLAAAANAPDPGVVCDDNTPAFVALTAQVRQALQHPPRKRVDLAYQADSAALCPGCMAVAT